MSRGGGTFCQFTVGATRPGSSARHLRYIARPLAHPAGLKRAEEGRWFQHLPSEITTVQASSQIAGRLSHYAHILEKEERKKHKSRGLPRIYYRTKLSFESVLPLAQLREMVSEWVQVTFPLASVAVFFHGDTDHLHAHLWIAARQINGKKINLDARTYRQLDERWNQLYARAFGRDEREHLLKKGETERFKQLWREGRDRTLLAKPERVGDRWHPSRFNELERKRLGDRDEREQSGTGTDQHSVAGAIDPTEGRAGEYPRSEWTADRLTRTLERTVGDAERALLETHRLRAGVARLVERTDGRNGVDRETREE